MDIIEGLEDLRHLTQSSLKSENLGALIKQSIDEAEECGADVQMFVCDRGGPNIGAYKKLGVKEENAAWQRYGILIVDGKEVAFKDVITTCNADQNNKLSNTLGRIRLEHLAPHNFQRQNARLAFQLVSHKMKYAMEAAKMAKIQTTETAGKTIWFLGKMNTVSDVCNSSNIFDSNPNKRPFSEKNPECFQIFEEFLVWGPTIQVKDKKTGKLIRIPFFKSIVATVRALLLLYRDMVAKYTSFQLLTTFYNTDSVKTLFSRIRGRGGYNPNPSGRIFLLTMRHMVAVQDLKSAGRGNVAPDNGSYLPAITSDEMDQ
ncbi:uncharacterized protein LOC117175566 [Belonocnema kinseyi]|uniref:uncharacterized protein LOC117175566 n=1 Tax=Belonocnema kinseyi TaxID=2817044 RepID=UPI00143D7C47|nr:uncharacterized protein LOC117175566 [Belonocnema kinseyi]